MPNLHGHSWAQLLVPQTGMLAAVVLLTAGCDPRPRVAVYRNPEHGLEFTPPAGWSERAHSDHGPWASAQERLLVQYKRLQAGNPAWLRVTVADLPHSTPLPACLAGRAPGRNWRREGNPQELEVSGQPASRVAFRGRWNKHDLVSETVAVRRAGRTYFFTGVFPASDRTAREQVGQAVASAAWLGPAMASAGR